MNAYAEACLVEEEAMQDIVPYLEARFGNRWVLTNKGRLSKEMQKKYGDVFTNDGNGRFHAIEIKAEKVNKWGNFFLEWWSNRSRDTHGWMRTLDADFLLYYFVEPKDLYVLKFYDLKTVLFDMVECGEIDDGHLKPQGKYEQRNDTWGYCVPIRKIVTRVASKHYNLNDGIRLVYDYSKVSSVGARP